jgi:hypothetical protein
MTTMPMSNSEGYAKTEPVSAFFPATPQQPEAKPGEAGLAGGELMRGDDAQHRRAARN